MKTIAVITFSALASVALAPAIAQQAGMQQRPQQDQQMQQATKQFQGEIISLRRATVEGNQHVLAKLKDQAGNDLVVDLGRRSELRQEQVRLKQGQRISGIGVAGRLNDQPILVATRFTADGRQVRLQQRLQDQAQAKRPMQQQVQAGGPLTVRGQVVDTRNVRLQGVRGEHNLVKLRSGQDTLIVDLGANPPRGLNLQKGDRVAVRGEAARINNQPVIFARTVAEIVQLNRGQMGQPGGGTGGRMGQESGQ